ncbi:MAG: hypothetical protein RL307_538, partial [Pseudomonadota bacterium]
MSNTAIQDIIILERKGDIALLHLNQPERLNPLGLALQQGLRERFTELANDRSVRALIITGSGKAFCVGADLSAMQSSDSGKTLGEQSCDTMLSLSNRIIE